MALNMDEAEKEMRGAVDSSCSTTRSRNGEVGSVGFCMGGGLSVWAAATNPQVGAVVTYYYVMPHGKPDFSAINGAASRATSATTRRRSSRSRTPRRSSTEIHDAGDDVEFAVLRGRAGTRSSTTPTADRAPTTTGTRSRPGIARSTSSKRHL